jgi:NAD(P)-dependent dehydrogenase (short-subunit alcohol dehydrogenase family)
MKVCILGDRSDIALKLRPMLEADGHDVWGWNRESQTLGNWHLIISCLGSVAPVGPWDISPDWTENFTSNVFQPIEWLKRLWPWRLPKAQVCFMAGSNPQKIMRGYAPYNASKMALLKVVEQLDFEEPEVKFFALGPGYIETKIHKPTHDINWPNERIARGNPNTVEQVYETLKWCLAQPKEAVGGRNICVSDLQRAGVNLPIQDVLRMRPDMFKLRRVE